MLMHFPYFAGCCMLLFNLQIVSFLSSFHHWLSMPTHFISWNWVLLDLSEIAYFKLGSCVTHLMLDLSIKKCVPCDLKDLRPMTEEVANGLLRQVGACTYVIFHSFFLLYKFMFLSALYCLGGWMEFGE